MRNIHSLCLTVLLFFSCAASVSAQKSLLVRGTITDEKGESLIGVNVVVKGSSVGTVTNIDGQFVLSVPDSLRNPRLVYSFIGYETKEALVGQNRNQKVILKEQAHNLNEMVVIGYGTTRRGDLTGSVSKLDASNLMKTPVAGFDQAVAGRIAGVQVNSREGQPGSDAEIVVRGANSLTQDNTPLYVIDGFPIESSFSNAIDPGDIESIEVLKDASATAIYGARGANGVIIITTKKGLAGTTQLSYDGYYGFQNVSNKIDVMDGYEFVKLQTGLYSESTIIKNYFKEEGAIDLNKYRHTGLDFQDYIFHTAPIQNHRVSLRSGTQKLRVSGSFSYMNQEGIIINSGFKRWQGRFNMDQDINNWLKIGMNASYSKTKRYGTSPSQATFSGTRNLMQNVWAYRPVSGSSNVDLMDEMFDPEVDSNNDYRVNPIVTAKNELRDRFETNLISNAYFQLTLPANLKWKSTIGYVGFNSRSDNFNNSKTRDGNPLTSKTGVNGSVLYSEYYTWLNENTLNFNKKIAKVHNIDAVGGFTLQGRKSVSNSIYMQMLPNEVLGMSGLDEGDFNKMSAVHSSWTLMSFLGRVNYNYNWRYYLTASFRADGSSKFPMDNRWGYFPSASFMWRVSKEAFMQDLTFLTDAKLRVSWGNTGNNRVNDFAYYQNINSSPLFKYYFGDEPVKGAAVSELGNEKLKWETTTQTNVGADVSLFEGRISLTADYYWKKTRDLLLNAELPGSTGFRSVYKNIGTIQNKGFELTINTRNMQRKNFTWTTDFNISFNRSKLLALAENQTVLSTSVSSLDNNWSSIPAYTARIGDPLGMMFGYKYEGTYKYDDFIHSGNDYVLKPGVPYMGEDPTKIQPGDMKYRDINGDGLINDFDRTIIGNGTPKHIGGLGNNLSFYNFDLSIFFNWSYGNDVINANRYMFEMNPKGMQNMYGAFSNRWSEENPNSDVPRIGALGTNVYSSYVVEDASYLRLSNLTLGYNFPSKIARKLYMANMRVYATGQNLFTWTRYSGMDPDVSVRHSVLSPGFDFSAYPRARTFTLGINLTLK